jgi:hypothetical protein
MFNPDPFTRATNTLLGGMRICTSESFPVPRQIRFPKKGPYWRRRNRKMQRDRRNWSEPEYFVIKGREIWCHPSVFHLIQQMLSRSGLLKELK